MFGDGVVIANSPQDFKEKVDYYLKNPIEAAEIKEKGYWIVKENHTNYHRAAQIMSLLGYESEAQKILKVVDEF
jgi:spore maturation protein CgeB